MEPIHKAAEADYLSGLKYKEIAEKYGVSENTVKSWKKRYGWPERDKTATKRATKTKKVATKGAEVAEVAAKDAEPDDVPDKYKLFAAEYMRDFNATRAAMVAGYSKATAYSAGWRLLKNVEVQAEIKRLKAEREADLGLDINRIISEYMKIAFADITDLVTIDEYGGVNTKDGSAIDGTVISEIKPTKFGVSIKLHDKVKALEKLERYVNYLTEEEQLKLAKLRAEIKAIERGDEEDDNDEGDGLASLRKAIEEGRKLARGDT
ncbi:terminase small subunit [Paenibacillus sp. P26]|nr:terminase small subunit [Paenibacillus sp. P26]UUZ93214.1 terminase small subunit [Paenibacillus sp. P25]